MHGVDALDVLAYHYPAKVLIAAVYRDARRGYVDWGVTAWRPFLAERGRVLLADEADITTGRPNAQGEPCASP